MHILLVQAGRKKLDVATATIDVLLVFDSELHHQRLVPVAEGLEAGGEGVETCILAGLDPWGEGGGTQKLPLSQYPSKRALMAPRVRGGPHLYLSQHRRRTSQP